MGNRFLVLETPYYHLYAQIAKLLEMQAQAQLERDLAEAEHQASMVARESNGANWYIDTKGGYL
ncbi:hypothetical protein N7447_008234 [Penicillium robsamsonii]|uniref:uncharacterized protein n=1 Tax=Penicillium robsamsonii TaxID=1792511 RepID=UPI0025478793|nr:uncharacterized protein N7447_008234 [Penicillium robsamsonii]KAJ5816001.1 hypothetical protein N7447_008234 [Penicillium robsamsonii]